MGPYFPLNAFVRVFMGSEDRNKPDRLETQQHQHPDCRHDSFLHVQEGWMQDLMTCLGTRVHFEH